MKLQEVITKYLTTYSGTSPYVSTRVHWIKAPQNSQTPYVVCSTVGEDPVYALAGPTGLVKTEVQFMVVSTSAQSVYDTMRLLDNALAQWPIEATIGITSYSIQAAVRKFASDYFDNEAKQFYSIVRYDFFYSD